MIIENFRMLNMAAACWRALMGKAFRESQTRFWAALIILTTLVFYAVLTSSTFLKEHDHQHPGEYFTYGEYIWQSLFNYYFQGFWVAAALVLGFGGLMRERSLGASAFTLGLPIRSSFLLLTRVIVGLGQACALGMLPVLLIPLLSPLTGHRYPAWQAAYFAFLLVSAGAVFLCFGVFLSTFIEKRVCRAGFGSLHRRF